MIRAIREVLWPNDLVGLFARLLGVFSGLALIRAAFGELWGFPLSLLFGGPLDLYDQLVGFALSWLEPYLKHLLVWLQHFVHWKVELHEHWRHVSVLVGIYFSRSVWIAFGNDRTAAVFRTILASLLAVCAGVLSGLLDVQQQQWLPNLLVALPPVLAVFAYGVVNGVFAALLRKEIEIRRRPQLTTRTTIFLGHARAAWSRTWKGIGLLLVGLSCLVLLHVPSPGLVVLSLLVGCLAGYFFKDGLAQAKRNSGRSWPKVYWKMDSTRLAASMAGVLAWDAISVGIDWMLGTLAT